MKATFQMSDLGLLSYLGIEVHQHSSGISLRQAAYTKRIVELGGLTSCNLVGIYVDDLVITSTRLRWRRSMRR
jgi:hypothetical protein